MSEVSFDIANRHVATVRLDPNSVEGRDIAGTPALYIPLKLQLLPTGQSGNVQYTIIRLAGTLQSQPIGDFARFEVSPLSVVSHPHPFDRQQDVMAFLDRLAIKRFEDARNGKDAHFQIRLSCLVWLPTAPPTFETTAL